VLPDGSPHPHAGTLDFSGDVVDPATGAISLRAVVPNPERRLLPGTYVSLRARLGQLRGVFAIPQAAVQRDARGAYVLVVGAEGQVARRDVALERAEGGNWIVSSGLEDGEQVIVSGLQKATIGGPATPVPWTPQGQAPGAPAPAPEGDDAPAEGGDEAPGRD